MNLQLKTEILDISLSCHGVTVFVFRFHPIQLSSSQGHLILPVRWSCPLPAGNCLIFVFLNLVLEPRFLLNILSRINLTKKTHYFFSGDLLVMRIYFIFSHFKSMSTLSITASCKVCSILCQNPMNMCLSLLLSWNAGPVFSILQCYFCFSNDDLGCKKNPKVFK